MVSIIFSPQYKNFIMQELQQHNIKHDSTVTLIRNIEEHKDGYIVEVTKYILQVEKLPSSIKSLNCTDWEIYE